MKRRPGFRAGLMLAAIVAAGPAGAATTADLKQCRGVADDAARLHCYDALVPAEPVAPVVAAPPVAAAAPATPAAPSADFGAETVKRKAGDAKEDQALHAKLIGHIETAKKGDRYQLDNGQVWQNIDDREVLVDVSDTGVTIQRNFLGTYFLQADGNNTRIKVRRTQ
jgi:hypothetical protein